MKGVYENVIRLVCCDGTDEEDNQVVRSQQSSPKRTMFKNGEKERVGVEGVQTFTLSLSG